MKTPFPPQLDHIRRLVAALKDNHAALDSSDTGTGKTLCAAEVAKALGVSLFVVCPKAAVTNWTRVLAEQGASCAGAINYEKLRTGNTPFGGWDHKRFKFALPANTLLVFDEMHACKGLYTKNAGVLIGAKPFRTLMLSATAAENPVEMRALGFLLNLHKLTDFYSWALRHGCRANVWGALEFKFEDDEEKIRRKHLDTINRMIYPLKGHKLTRSDLKEFFSATQIIYDPVEFGSSSEIKKLYEEVAEEMDALVAREKASAAELVGNPAEAMVALTRARQKVELLKLPEIRDLVLARLDEGMSVPVFLNYNDSITALSGLLTEKGVRHGVVWGDDTKNRDTVLDNFQHDRVHVLLCNIAAGGTAINLHHTETSSRPRESLISPCFNAKIMRQVFGRIDRAGALTPTTNRVLIAAGSVEERVMASLQIKIDNLDRLHHKLAFTTPMTPTEPEPTAASLAAEPEPTPAAPSIEVEVIVDPPVSPASELKKPRKPRKPREKKAGLPAAAVPATERAHARFSPSKLEYIALCPGYVSGDSTEYAREAADSGTRCHHACETRDFTGLTEEERLLVDMCLGYEDDVIAGAEEVFREIKVEMFDQFGFLDLLAVRSGKKEADILDFKFGRVQVRDATLNMQMKGYAVGVWESMPDLESITVHLAQPRTDTISTHTWHKTDLPLLRAEIELVLKRATTVQEDIYDEKNIAVFNPLCEACDYCGNMVRCKALARRVIPIVSTFGGREIPPTVMSVDEVRSPAESGVLLRLAKLATKWADFIGGWALSQALTEGIVPEGFNLKEVNNPRKVTNPTLAWEVLREASSGVISIEDVLACAPSLAIGKLETIFAETAPKGGKAKAKEALASLLMDAGAMTSEGSYHKLEPEKNK